MSQRLHKDSEPVVAQTHNLSHDGRGIANIAGKTTFIFGALPHETVKFRYTKKRAKFDEGVVTEVIQPSAERTTPHCPHFTICGGCTFQHLSHASQVQYKQKILAEILEHQAHIAPEQWLEPLVASPWGYRRKARISTKFVIKKNKMILGFHERNSRYIADLQECHVLHPSVGKNFPAIQALLESLEIKTAIPQLEIAVDEQGAALIIRHMQPLPAQDQQLIKDFAKAHHYKIYLQPHGPDRIELFYPEHEDALLSYRLPHQQLTLKFHPAQFVQVHAAMNEKMIDQALQLLDLDGKDHVLDLFCGIGNFTLPIAKYAAFATGVEGDPQAIAQARHNVELNQIANCEFHEANLFDEALKGSWVHRAYDKILLDPPRTGAKELIAKFKTWLPQRIVYVSCNPATLARDAQSLMALGFQFKTVGVMDMFPHTQHIEAMALFERGS